MQAVADNHAASSRRLNVRPVPGSHAFGYTEKRTAIRTVPVKAVTAESDADVVRLLPVVAFAAEHCEETQQNALVADAIQVVDFHRHVVLGAARVGGVGTRPQHRLELG